MTETPDKALPEYTMELVRSLEAIDPTEWATCAATDHPFVHYDFLRAMETSEAVGARAGWLPHYLVLKDPTEGLKGIAPMYIKTHSQGEYVFDHGWADAYDRAVGQYYPKLQVSVPFTPVTGPRLLVADDAFADVHRQALAEGLKSATQQLELSSVHVTFLNAQDRQALQAAGFDIREDRQFHWENQNFETFDAFLETLNSRKRKEVKKERRQAVEADITIHWLTGDQLTPDVWDAFYAFYLDTGRRKWGTPYLNLDFFQTISQILSDKIVLIMAQRAGRWVAGALNMIDGTTIYGRYWGSVEYHPSLHFEICYYQAIDYAIAHHLQRVEAGAQGGHKLARGYAPTTTYSAHWFPHAGFRDAIAQYLERERDMVAEDNAYLTERTPFKKDPNAQK